MKYIFIAAAIAGFASHAQSQTMSQETPANAGAAMPMARPVQSMATSTGRTAAAGTLVVVTPMQEVSSKHAKVGDKVAFRAG